MVGRLADHQLIIQSNPSSKQQPTTQSLTHRINQPINEPTTQATHLLHRQGASLPVGNPRVFGEREAENLFHELGQALWNGLVVAHQGWRHEFSYQSAVGNVHMPLVGTEVRDGGKGGTQTAHVSLRRIAWRKHKHMSACQSAMNTSANTQPTNQPTNPATI